MLKRAFLISLGTMLLWLTASSAVAQPLAQAPVVCEQDYTVAAGDWLSKLAEKYYGNAQAYLAIATQTNLKSETDFSYATIVNPDSIEVGMKLCIPDAARAAALNGDNPPPGLAKTALANASYSTELTNGEPVAFSGGKFTRQDVPNSPLMTEIMVTDQIAYGDINGVPSAAVISGGTGGGSGYFYDLHVMQIKDGKPTEVGVHSIGDRSPVIATIIENNQVKVDFITQGPDQPFCCGTLRDVALFALEGNQLNVVDQKELGYLGPNGETPGAPIDIPKYLIGPTWQWLSSTTPAGTVNVDDPSRYTIQFLADGTTRLKADCNTGSGPYVRDGSNITIGPLLTTLVGCPEGSRGTEFLDSLQNAATVQFQGPDLILELKADAGSMKLVK